MERTTRRTTASIRLSWLLGSAASVAGLVATGCGSGDGGPVDDSAASLTFADAGVPICGNGMLEQGEKCDTAIGSGFPGTCPVKTCGRVDPCVPRTPMGSACQRDCIDSTPITAIKSQDMCCAGATDVDCPVGFPYQASVTGGSRSSTSCGASVYWRDTNLTQYVALAPTCGVPIVVTTDGTSSNTSAQDSTSVKGVWLSGYSTEERVSLGIQSDRWRQQSFLLETQPGGPTFATIGYNHRKCSSNSIKTWAYFDARPLAPTDVPVGGAPIEVRVVGNSLLQYLVLRDAPADSPSSVRVVIGRQLPHRFVSFKVTPASWTTSGSLTLSTPGANATDIAATVQPLAPYANTATPTRAHVVWVEDGTSLHYASLDSTGVVAQRKLLRSGLPIRTPSIAFYDVANLGVLWVEGSADTARIRLALLSPGTGEILATSELGDGQGDVSNPTIATEFSDVNSWTGAAAFVATRAGKRQIYLQDLKQDGTQASSPRIFTELAVDPDEPTIRITGSYVEAVWTDRRDGTPTLYATRQLRPHLPYSGYRDLRVSPVGEIAQHPRLALASVDVRDNGMFVGLNNSRNDMRIVWRAGEAADRVMLSQVNFVSNVRLYGHFPLSCSANVTAHDAAILDGNALPDDLLVPSTIDMAAWIEGGALKLQPVFMQAVTPARELEWGETVYE